MPEWVMQLFGMIGCAGAVYGGIRSDIKALHEKLSSVEKSTDEAHKRIDTLLLKH